MSRRVNRIPVVLDTGNVKELSPEDIKMILRAADMCIMKAGRNINWFKSQGQNVDSPC